MALNLDTLTLGDLKQLTELVAQLNGGQTPHAKPSALIGKYVVVRTYSAGAYCGVLQERNGKNAVLTEARILWQWKGANTLTEVATSGVGDGSRISAPAPMVELTETIAVIACTDGAEKNLRGAKWKA